MGFLASFGFSSPYLIAVLPLAVGALVYAYLKRGRGSRHVVASILVLRKLHTTMSARQRFVPPPRFFFELLLLALLGLAAAGVYRRGPEERVALVIDNSLSMRALTDTGETRFVAALRDIRAFIGNFSDRARMTLFVTSPTLHQVGEDLLASGEVMLELDEIRPTFARDTIEVVLSKLVQDQRFDRVVAWSDKKLASPNTRLQLRTQVSKGSGNLAVRDVRIERQDNNEVVIAEVASFGDHETAAKVSLTALDQRTGNESQVTIAEKVVKLPISSSKNVAFPVASLAQAYGVKIESAEQSRRIESDALPDDNVGFLATTSSSNRIVVVSSEPVAKLGLQHLRSFAVQVKTLEQFTAAAGVTTTADSLVIFHRVVPRDFPLVNALFVMPPPTTPLAEMVMQGSDIQMTRWSDSHPVVSYLNLPLLSLRTLVRLRTPSWAEEIISSTAGAAAFAGEYRGHRYVGIGFEIFPYVGKQEPVLSILLLNVLKWLSGAGLGSSYEQVPYLIPAQRNATEVNYLASSATVHAEGGQYTAEVPGILSITSASQRELKALNFFEEGESNLLTPRIVSVPEVTILPDERSRGSQPLLTFLVWSVIALLLVDLLISLGIFSRRRAEVLT